MTAGSLRSVALLCALAALAPAPARADGLVHVVSVSTAAQFAPGTPVPVTIGAGDRLLVVNTDYPGEQSTHDLVHDAPDPLFASAEIAPGEMSEVYGLSELDPGTYAFHCFIHPTTMRGTLLVRALSSPA